ncbi:unnamed protein product [Coregonus sp. 'balchen']|nr:unnamed protein product [Coregonus sp. 'balchen']
MKDTEFTTSNHVFLGNIKQLRRQRKYITNSHPPITNEDMAQLQNSQALNPGTPRGLVQKVWFHLQLHLGQRGKEGNRQLKPNSFLVKTDENGLRYATLAYNESTNNHLDPRARGRESKRRFMFEQPGNPLCPVASRENYLLKCPENALEFYLHPRRGECIGDSIWYTTEPMGGIGNNYIEKSQHQDHDSQETGQCWFRSEGDDVSEWASLLASLTDRQKTLDQHPGRKQREHCSRSTPKRLKQSSRSSSTDSDISTCAPSRRMYR